MRSWRIVAVLLLCLVLAGATACNPFGDGSKEEASQQLVKVVRGDLIVSVSGSGTMEVANEAELAFSIDGRIDKIYVEEGDEVSKGDVLAKLDTAALELTLLKAQTSLIQAQVSLQSAENDLKKAKCSYTDEEIEEQEDEIYDAEEYLDFAKDMLAEARQEENVVEEIYWHREVYQAQANLNAEEDKLVEMLAPPADEDEVELAQMQVEAAELSLEQAQKELEQAQKDFDNEIITAPWDGVVASVSADEGDSISTVTTIVHLIDPTSMELNAEVDEIDIPDVKPGQRAIIEVDALPALQLEGEVTAIGLLPTVEAGIVLYDVTIGLSVSGGTELKVGMSATVDIIVHQRSNVLLVPNRAITQDRQGNPVVKVMVNEQIEERPVVIGISDGYQTEIISGLDEGETVVIELRAGTEPTPSPGLFHR